MMIFTLFTADGNGNEKNTLYPHRAVIDDPEKLKAAAVYDHVGAEFQESRRSTAGFIISDVSVMDCDNDGSENPADWIKPEKYAEMFPGVAFAVVPSRNDRKAKGSYSPRSRQHVYFPHKPFRRAGDEAKLKQQIHAFAPCFDGNALDGARFIYGHSTDTVLWHEGELTIDEFLSGRFFNEFDEASRGIKEGSRNSTMSHLAGRIIKRYGATEEAHQIYIERSTLCQPPLSEIELDRIWGSAVKFGERISKEEDYIPPDKYNRTLKPEDYSDMGQAKAICREYRNSLVYTDATGFLCYDGIRWVESKQMAVGVCEEFVDRQLDEAVAAVLHAQNQLLDGGISEILVHDGGKKLENAVGGSNVDSLLSLKDAQAYKAFVMKRRDIKYILAALEAAKPMVLKDVREFDSQEFLLNTPKGTYDLRKGMQGYREHRAENYITKAAIVSPDNTNEELWLACVGELFLGDVELMEYVQQIVGLAAIGKVYQESLIIAYGDGCNGKSTFWNAIARVLGNYSGTLSADALTIGCRRNVKPEMAELKGKRLVIAAELDEGMRLNTSLVKQLCSTDEVYAEKKYKDPFKYVPTHTIVLYTNHLPKVGANDDGTWRRLIVIPFEAKIQGKSDIKNYADYLVTHAGGAILKWIIEGAEKAIACGFHIPVPDAVKKAVGRYRENNDWLAAFITSCCDTGSNLTEKSGRLYEEYRSYCGRNGEWARSTADFYTALEFTGFHKKKTKHGSIVHGLQLHPEFFE